MSPEQTAPPDFAGITRLFPLPSLVMFPHALQPLHVFEQRYRRMMDETVAGDMLMSLVMLKPDWDEEDYDLAPAVEPVACLGRVETYEPMPDGRYNLLLRGLSRARIAEELVTEKPYRVARVELLSDLHPDDPAEVTELRRGLLEAVAPHVVGGFREQVEKLFASPMELGPLCDLLGYALPLALDAKQTLLGEPNVAARVAIMIDRLRPREERPWPPDFSVN